MTKILKLGKRVVCLTMVMLLMIACLPLNAFAARPNIVIINSSVNSSSKGSNVVIVKDAPEEPKAKSVDDAVDYVAMDVAADAPVAQIGEVGYATLAEAIAAAKNGDTIMLLTDCAETVHINKSGIEFTIDGAISETQKATFTGKIEINIGQNISIKNINFVYDGDASHDFIANVGSPTGKNYNTTLVVDGCSFDGNGKENTVAVRTIHPTSVTIKNSTGKELHSFLQNTGGQKISVKNITITDSKGGLACGTTPSVTVRDCNIQTNTYGIRLDATIDGDTTLNGNTVKAYIPVSVRKATAQNYKLNINGTQSMTATNPDNVWCAICANEYEDGVSLNIPTGNVKVAFNSTNLTEDGMYGAYEWPVFAVYSDGYTKGFDSLMAAMNHGYSGGEQVKIVVNKDITESMSELRGNIVTENPEGVTIKNTIVDAWIYCGNDFTIDKGVTYDATGHASGLFMYAANAVINGTVLTDCYYQRYANTKLTINEPGNMTVKTETFILRYTDGDGEAGIYIVGDNDDSTIGLNAAVIYFYQGCINAKDADIKVGTYWQTNGTDNQGSANLILDNSNMTVTVNEHNMKATGNSTVTLTNGSNVSVAGDYEGADVSADETSSFTVKGESIFVAEINGVRYQTLKAAVEAVQDGGTIVLLRDVIFTQETRTHNSADYYDGLYYVGDKSFTLDLGGYTISQDGAVNDYLLNFKNDGTKANTITIKNGTLDAGTTAFCAICTSGASTQKITINLENINVINNHSNGSTIKVRGGAELNVKDGTVITGKNSYLGIECVASTVNIYDGAEIYMNGTSSYNGCLVGVGSGGTVNVYGGYGKGVSGGFIAMTSGGTINVSGGEWIANTDGTFANSNKSVLVSQSEGGAKSVINVSGGIFKGGYNCYGDAAGDAQISISGGNFNADPSSYLADSYVLKTNSDGTYGAKVENEAWILRNGTPKFYSTLAAAIADAQAGETVILIGNVTLDERITLDKDITISDYGSLKISIVGNAGFSITNGANVVFDSFTLDISGTTAKGDCIFGVGNYSTNGTLTLTDVNVVGNGYSSAYAVFYVYNESVLNITGGEFNLSNDKASAGGFIKAEQGKDGIVNITNAKLNLTDAKIGFLDGTVTMDGVELTIEGGANAINQSALTVKNSTIIINGADGRALTLSQGDVTIINSTLNFSNCSEGEIRFKKGLSLTIDADSTISDCLVYVDASAVDVANVNGTKINGVEAHKASITNGTLVNPEWAAKYNNNYYWTVQDAVNALVSGDNVITLLKDVAEDVTIKQIEGVNVVINGNDNKFSGTFTIHGSARYNGAETLTFQDINFVTDEAGHYFIDANSTASAERYAHNVTVKDCSFTATGAADDNAVAMRIRQGFNISIIGVKSNGMHSVLQAYGNAGIAVNDLKIESGKNGISAGTSTNVVIENAKINVDGYGVRADGSGNYDLTVKNSEIDAELPIVVRKNTEDGYTLTIDGNTLNGANEKHSAVIFTKGDDGTYETPSVSVTINGNADNMFPVLQAKLGDKTYFTLADAFAAANDGDTIVLLTDIALSETIKNTKKITLDLNGKTITGTDNNTSGNFYLFDNRGELTVTGNGTITLTATTDRDWNSSSVVIANNPGGKLTIENGTIKHLGGTDMAYGIDNLTNGKGTYAETVINGGTIKSTYRAIRQFLNGVEAQNILTINGGTVEGGNKAVWFQDPSKNANSGKLTIGKDAIINGDIYLTVTEGSTEWPVEVSINSAALQGESKIATSNIPAGYEIPEIEGVYTSKSGVAKIGNEYYATLAAAAAAAKAGDEIKILVAGTYKVPTGKNLTITGAVAGVKFDMSAAVGVNASMTFNNVTFEYGNKNYVGLQHAGDMVYNNCTINGQVFLYGTSETFNNCTFNQTSSAAYNVWTYGAKKVAFNKCTFNSAGKSVLIYAEGANISNEVTVTKSTFNASAVADGKAAIEMDSSLTAGITLTIDDATTATGFGTGNVSGNSLWNNKKGNEGVNNDIKVSVNDEIVLQPIKTAEINGVYYTTLEAAFKAATDGCVINILSDVTIDDAWDCRNTGAKFTVPVTINGNGHTIKFTNTVYDAGNYMSAFRFEADATVKDLTIDMSEAKSGFQGRFRAISAKANLTIDGCTFIGNGADNNTRAIIFGEGAGASVGNLVISITNSNFEDWKRGVSDNENAQDVKSVTITGNTFKEAGVTVSAAEKIIFNSNNMDDCGAVLSTYAAANNLAVEAKGNTLDVDQTNSICAKIIDAQDGFETPVAKIGEKYYVSLSKALAACKEGETVLLLADVDLNNVEWEPVEFKGTFDGNNHKISNLVVNKPGVTNVGFFSKTEGAEIRNVIFENAKVTGRLNVGVVAGHPWTTKYTNITVTGHVEVNGMAYVGGVGGKNAYADWTDIKVDVDSSSYVSANSVENGVAYRTYVGGVIGFIGEGSHTFTNISSNIKVIGSTCDIGGLFGIAHYGTNFDGVTFTGSVEAPADAEEVGGIAGVWHNAVGNTVIFNNVTSTGTVTVGTETTTGSVVGGAYNPENEEPGNSGSLKIDGKEAWIKVAQVGNNKYLTLEEAAAAAQAGDTIKLLDNVTLSATLTLPAGITLDGNGKTISGTIQAGGDLTFVGNTTVSGFSAGWYNNTITIGEGASLKVTGGRVTVSYGNIFNVTGSITDAKNADKSTLTPSLEFTAGISFNGNGGSVQFNVTKAYVVLGDSSTKNSGATGEFNLNFTNSIVDFTNTLKTYMPTASGLAPEFNLTAKDSVISFASHLEFWLNGTNVELDNTDLTVGGSFANAGTVTLNNNSNFVVNAPIMSSHGGNTGTINVLGGVFELKDSNQDWENAGTIKIAKGGQLITNDFKCVGDGKIAIDAKDITEYTVLVDGNGVYDFSGVTTVENLVKMVVSYANGDVTLLEAVAQIGEGDAARYYLTFADALNAVQNGETITILDGATGDESKTEIEFTKVIAFTITGNAPKYALPVITFQNATVTIKDAEILIPELDARQNATINVVNSIVHDAGGNSIAKSYYNGAINIVDSTVYMMQLTTMGYVTISGNSVVNVTWQTNVYGNGMITVKEGATLNTAALHLTGKDYSGRDNTDADRVGKPATIIVDGATFTVGKVYSDNGADYSYNSSKGINIGTIEGKAAVLDIKNGANVNIYMANGETANIGADGIVNVDGSTFNVACRKDGGKATLANNGTIYVTGESNIAATVTGEGWVYMNGVTLNADTKLHGAKVGFINGTNNIVGSVIDGGFFSVGIGQNASAEAAAAFAAANGITLGGVTVNVSGNAVIGGNGATYSVWVGSAYSADKTQNKYVLNIENSLATFGYMHISKDGELNVKGHSDNKYTYDNSNVDFYAGDFIINGTATFDGTDAWVKYTKMSVDHEGGVLNIVNGTNYESSIHNGSNTSTSLKFWKAGTIKVDGAALVVDNGIVTVEGSEWIVNNATVITDGAFDNKGAFTVSGESTLDIATLIGNRINVAAGTTLKDSSIGGSITMLGDLTIDGGLTLTGGLWASNGGTLSGDTLTALYFMFQSGTYTINADIEAVYGYLSFNGTFEVNSKIHTTGTNGEVLYINGNVTLNDGAVLDSDNSVFLSNDNAVLTIKSGAKVDSNVNITTAGAQLNLDITGMTAGEYANVTGTLTNSGNGTIEATGSDTLEVAIVNNKIALIRKLAGSGTEADPYKIGSVEDLVLFRDSVNAGETRYNAPGVYVALTADIDMAGATWERGIGDGINATYDGIFDGKNFTIKNLNFAPKADAYGYVCGGLFGYTYGAAVIKNLVLENMTVTTADAGHNVGILVGFANNNGGKLTVSNVTVKNVTIDAPNVYGVGAIVGYSYYAMGTIENCHVDGATITGYSFVGGITGYSFNDAIITECSVKNATITATSKGAGGIAGLANGNNVITNNIVENTTVTAPTNWGYVVGELGANSAEISNNTAAEPAVGGAYATGESYQAKIGNQYYTSLAEAIAAAKTGEVIVLTGDITSEGTTVLANGITIDLNGHTLTTDYLVAFKGNDIVDNTRGTGLLKVAKDSVMLSKDNSNMAVWTGEGYRFASVKLAANDGTPRYEVYNMTETGFSVKFRPGLGSAVQEYLNTATEVLASGMQIIVRLSWTDDDGVRYQDFVYNEADVATMYNSTSASETGALSLTVKNVGDYKNLDVTLILNSETGAQVSQHLYTFNATTITE